MKQTIKYNDPSLSYEVCLRHAICIRHSRLAARDNQPAIARDMGCRSADIGAFLRGERDLKRLTQAQRNEIRVRYARSQRHTVVAQAHAARVVYNELGIAANTHARIVQERKKLKAERKRRATATAAPVHRFLTMRMNP